MSAPHPPEDRDLMQRIEAGDDSALALLYERYGRIVYSLTLRVLQNPALAEEATQDTFIKVWRKSTRWDPAKGRLSSWLLTVARYTAIDRLRSEQRQSPDTADIDAVPPIAGEGGIPDAAELLDSRQLQRLLGQLPVEQAEVIQLAFFQGLTHSELAERLGLPLGTVKTRVRLGLKKLKGLWQQAEGTSRRSDPD